MIAEIEVLPTPSGRPDAVYAHVEAAIAVIAGSGLAYEVEPLGTSFEGPPDQVWAVLRQVHEATLNAGAEKVISVVKLFESVDDAGPGMDDLTGKFRE
jgi:uncharacterized protein YqgV (UPF0045/DUF77 family)